MRHLVSLVALVASSAVLAFVPQQRPLFTQTPSSGHAEDAFDWDAMVAVLTDRLMAPPASNVSVCWKDVLPRAPSPPPPFARPTCQDGDVLIGGVICSSEDRSSAYAAQPAACPAGFIITDNSCIASECPSALPFNCGLVCTKSAGGCSQQVVQVSLLGYKAIQALQSGNIPAAVIIMKQIYDKIKDWPRCKVLEAQEDSVLKEVLDSIKTTGLVSPLE